MADLAIVGAGIMGANHVRTARSLREWERVVVVDPDRNRAQAVAGSNGFRTAADLASVLGLMDAVIIAAPNELHEPLARDVLAMHKHVLIEKPLAHDIDSARKILSAAQDSNGKVLVGHIERFNAAVAELMQWAGEAEHIEFRRIGPRGNRRLGDVVSDLMVHDLELFLAMAAARDGEPARVENIIAMWAGAQDDMCTALLRTSTGLSATFTASLMGQEKRRNVILTGKDVQVVGDLVRQAVTIDRIEHVEFVDERGARYRQRGSKEIPFLDAGEPLRREQRHFLDVVTGQADPLVGAEQALAAMELVQRVCDAADAACGRDAAGADPS
ncbi:MAG: hypothetical protein CSA58_02215 [Micrococcales bacterium]|nr:MAG: hypothetical protein CSB46_05660 [Micrococcales bacterium]PIE27797.1 MAG: hypothetical protein CSA58_02215 [Micrococcales bacterium]